MQGSTGYRRQSRQRQARQEPGDAIVIALTAQVMVCVLLLLAALLTKKLDETRYDNVKTQYHVLVSDAAESEKVFSFFTGGGIQSFFTSAEDMVSALLSRFNGAGEGVLLPEGEIAPDSQSDIEEPLDEPPQSDDPGTEAFSFNYLETSGISAAGLGQGGLFPVQVSDIENESLPAPEGCSLAPVAIAARVLPPVTGIITSEFAYRYHPISGGSDFHNGMDIASNEGDDIFAALPGEVVEVGWSDIYGNYIILQHAINLQTFYAHCSEIIAEAGSKVREGERIAKVGQTGVATGPHLHFSVIVEGEFTDPYWVLQDNIKLVE